MKKTLRKGTKVKDKITEAVGRVTEIGKNKVLVKLIGRGTELPYSKKMAKKLLRVLTEKSTDKERLVFHEKTKELIKVSKVEKKDIAKMVGVEPVKISQRIIDGSMAMFNEADYYEIKEALSKHIEKVSKLLV